MGSRGHRLFRHAVVGWPRNSAAEICACIRDGVRVRALRQVSRSGLSTSRSLCTARVFPRPPWISRGDSSESLYIFLDCDLAVTSGARSSRWSILDDRRSSDLSFVGKLARGLRSRARLNGGVRHRATHPPPPRPSSSFVALRDVA